MMPASLFIARCSARGITLSVDAAGMVQVCPAAARRDGIEYYVTRYNDDLAALIAPKIARRRNALVQSNGAIQRPVPRPTAPTPAVTALAAPIQQTRQNTVWEMPQIIIAPVLQPIVEPVTTSCDQVDELDIDDPDLVAMGQAVDWDAQEALYDEMLSAAAYFAYLAARDNLMPIEPVTIAPGTVATDPNRCMVAAVQRSRHERERYGADYRTSPYTNFDADNTAIEQIAFWYRDLVSRRQIDTWYGDHINNPRNSGCSSIAELCYPWKGTQTNGNYAYLYRSERRSRARTRHTANRQSLCASVLS